MKKTLTSLLVAGAVLSGCGHSAPHGDPSSADPAHPVATDDAAHTAIAALSSTCAPSVAATDAKVAFSTTLDCTAVEGEASCPADALTLEATTDSNPTTGVSTSAWTIRRGETTVVTKTVSVQAGTTTIQVDFGADFRGIQREVVVSDGSFITGSMDGRELVRTTIAAGQPPATLEFVDHGPVPDAEVPAAVQADVTRLLDQAIHDAPIRCAAVTGTPGLGSAGSVVSSLSSSFWHAGLTQTTADIALSNVAPSSTVSPSLTSPNVPSPTIGSTTQALTNGTPAPQGVAPDFTASSRQNNLLDFETPDCQSCTHSCAKRILDYFVPGLTLECIGECFIPKSGGCAEDPCIAFGVSTCDDNQTCCGGSVCCGGNTTCGSDTLGVCCPKSLPIACGSRSGQGCFAAGSTCCGNGLNVACGPGQACINVTATSASCCTASHVASDGACCDQPACGGQCCDGGNCVNGQCCFGTFNSSGTCCGFGSTACGANCCGSDTVCTSGNTCCPQAQACGNTCCQSGQACVNGACTGCSAGTVPCNTSDGPSSLCCAPGAQCSPTECCPSGQAYCSTRGDCRDPSDCPGIP